MPEDGLQDREQTPAQTSRFRPSALPALVLDLDRLAPALEALAVEDVGLVSTADRAELALVMALAAARALTTPGKSLLPLLLEPLRQVRKRNVNHPPAAPALDLNRGLGQLAGQKPAFTADLDQGFNLNLPTAMRTMSKLRDQGPTATITDFIDHDLFQP